jgi:hypothetical protein
MSLLCKLESILLHCCPHLVDHHKIDHNSFLQKFKNSKIDTLNSPAGDRQIFQNFKKKSKKKSIIFIKIKNFQNFQNFQKNPKVFKKNLSGCGLKVI